MSSETLTLTLDSSSLYLKSHPSLSTLPPLSPIPTDFPLPKLIPKTRFIIDGFRFSGDHSVSYFLSHFHSDHYTGLTHNWSNGIIFCSHTTARLLVQVLNVSSAFVFPLSLSKIYVIDGCEVYLIDANHCPGAVQFLFKVPVSNGKYERYVHTGDFRYCDSMKLEPALSEFVGADAVFLDTTYCNPKFVFPLQEESIDYVVSVIDRIGVENRGNAKSVLFLVATYVIGKEKILLEISRRCKRKIYVEDKKLSILGALGFEEDGVFTKEEGESDVHVVGWNVLGETWPYFRPNFVKMKEIMNEKGYSKVVGFVPTGWTYEVKRNKFAVKTKDSFEIHLVPYSEHSNYDELREYVGFLRPKRVIPTVGLDVENVDGKHVAAMRKHFTGLVDEMAIKQEFLMRFHRGPLESDEKLEAVSSNATDKVVEQDNEVTYPDKGADGNICGGKVIDCKLPDQQPVSRDMLLLNDAETEEMLQELRDCLPSWVTRDQMLDLLSRSGGNVVEAVSIFYEHETEFHEQVVVSTSPACESQVDASDFHKQGTAHTSFACASQISSLNDSKWPSDPFSVHDTSRSVGTPLLQSYRSPNANSSVKSSTSPSRKRKKSENKSNKKKSRVNSNLEPGGPKQYTITRFFSKLSPVVSQDNEPMLDPCRNTMNSSPGNPNGRYNEKVDQFIQIIDGNESVRSYAATILEEAKGDINRAVDMYYSNIKGEHNEENVGQRNDMVKGQCSVDICSSDDETKRLEGDNREKSMAKNLPDCVAVNPEKDSTDILRQELPTGSLARDFISLPPEKYSPIEHACWKDGQPAPYLHLARTFSLLEDKKGKLRATSILCNMFRSLLVLSPDDVLPAIYLCTNKIAPDHENMELSIGGSIVTAALEEACGTNRSRIRDLYNSLGDLGDVAQLCRQTQSLLAPPPPLSVKGVFSALQKISVQTGSGSTVRKKSLIVNLMRSCREKEIKFIVRTLVRNLRIGAMMKTVLPALAQAVAMNASSLEGKKDHSKEVIQGLSAAVIEAYNILPNMDLLVPSLLEKGIQFSATTLSMIPGIPIKPMLAKITNGIPQVLKVFQNKAFTCEYKYDGQRAQIHRLDDGSVRVFSRNGDETTSRFPDLVDIIRDSCTAAAVSFILDAEVVAVDRKNGYKLMSFQELSSRERGSKDSLISVESIKVDICIFAFDVMFANGEQLLGVPLRQRRKRLKDLFGDEKSGYFEFAKEMTVEADEACVTDEATLAKMNQFLDNALRSSCEGIMVKTLDLEAGYTPSKRSETWLKLKRDYVEGLNDSLDLVPIGAWYGNGRKAGWYSPFLVACYNPDTEEYQSVCRVMSGFSDAFYVEMKEFFSDDKILTRKPPYYQTAEVPDKWFSPELVWAIRGADFTVSPVHHAAIGLVHPSRGISIRFPRFLRTVSDRKPEECSSSTDIAEMFQSQTRKMDVDSGH